MRRFCIAAVTVLALVCGACSSDEDTVDAGSMVDVVTTIDDGAEESEASVWIEHETGPDCKCADGSEYTVWSRTENPEKVVLYFEGGGACFSAETCDFEDGTYKTSAATSLADAGDEVGGIFDFANEDNPFHDWSFVFVPYCTGDVHIGDNTYAYTEDLEVNHVGFVNASAALDRLVTDFPTATEIFVTGSSAGGVPAPMFGALVADELPEASVAVLSDASGAYPDNPPVNEAIGGIWGTFNNLPDWSVNEGMTAADWSIPGLFVQAGLHNSDVRMARYDNAYDEVQQQFSELAEVGGDDELQVILANEAQIEDAGVPIHSYIAPGTDHTILGSDDVYSLEVEGVTFLDWLTRYVAGDDVEDVLCAECDRPDPSEEPEPL